MRRCRSRAPDHEQFCGGLVSGFGGAIAAFFNDVNFVARTPEKLSYNNDLVKQFGTAAQVLANALLAVVTLVGGFNVMLRPYLGSTYQGVLEFLPRLLLGVILVNTAAWWGRLAIDANNAACVVFDAPNLADIFSTLLRVANKPLTGLLMGLVVVVMGLLLVIQQLMRLALVDVLLILAPLAAPTAAAAANAWVPTPRTNTRAARIFMRERQRLPIKPCVNTAITSRATLDRL
jgi:hypothetical protein